MAEVVDIKRKRASATIAYGDLQVVAHKLIYTLYVGNRRELSLEEFGDTLTA